MTEKQKKNLRPIKKGEVRNPNGAKTHKAYRFNQLTREEVNKIVTIVATRNVKELQEIIHDPDSSALYVAYAACMVRLINKGDVDGIETLIQRVVGKVKDEVDMNHTGIPASQVVTHVYIPPNGSTKEENQ